MRRFLNLLFYFLKSPSGIIKTVSTYGKYWIPAFAGMTPDGLTIKYPQSHSCVSGKVPKETSRGYKPRAKAGIQKIKFLTVI
ncbi:MAG: hypothetical protein ACYCTB_00435 [bacterium]